MSRARMPGSRRAWGLAVAALAAGAVAASAVLAFAGGGRAHPHAASSARYGKIPSWLPHATIPVNRVVTATASHSWLAVEGDTVIVKLLGGRATATAVGPVVPEDGQFPVPATSPCTFTVTFTAVSGAVPLRADAFTILDELSHVHHPAVTLAGGGRLPAYVPRGRAVSLRIHEVLPTGNGQLRWAPEGSKPIVSWDFDVEID